jgi:DNA-binding beta-propeller fold protein YncE
MKRLIAALYVLSALSAAAQTAGPLALQRTITLTGVKGRFDHFAIDEAGKRLFAAATGNGSVEVVDLTTGKISESIPGLGKPHGLAWIAETGRLFVADGGKGELDVFSGSPFHLVRKIRLSEDADDMVYDGAGKMLYVGSGGTNSANPSAITAIDADSLAVVATLPTAAHPEALELDAENDRIFANISDTGEVLVIDGHSHTIIGKWALADATGNTPMAYDSEDGLLLVGCRKPAKLHLLNAKTGAVTDSADSTPGADDLFYEPSIRRAYLITGAGSVDTYAVSADGKLRPLPATATIAGAKTGLLVPSQKTLYVGIPGASGSSEIRVYSTAQK